MLLIRLVHLLLCSVSLSQRHWFPDARVVGFFKSQAVVSDFLDLPPLDIRGNNQSKVDRADMTNIISWPKFTRNEFSRKKSVAVTSFFILHLSTPFFSNSNVIATACCIDQYVIWKTVFLCPVSVRTDILQSSLAEFTISHPRNLSTLSLNSFAMILILMIKLIYSSSDLSKIW